MRIETPKLTGEFGFLNTEDVDLYEEMAPAISDEIVKRNFGITFFELSDSSRDDVELLRLEVYRIIKEENERGRNLLRRYRLHSEIITSQQNGLHHILIFSKKPWREILWEEITSKVKQTNG